MYAIEEKLSVATKRRRLIADIIRSYSVKKKLGKIDGTLLQSSQSYENFHVMYRASYNFILTCLYVITVYV